ncbi:unnamed protein product [Rhizoctonia solani]|uniref:Uncharacterized protein n=1 Tax=Rhizoctonia solani TaxID=456999 RepID=A0A8H3D2R8_9AGAM|nr:unnamed protein product [Rhizoctonia solani]CAE6505363.1 unnamed protein product [Rhizoctonia solani]
MFDIQSLDCLLDRGISGNDVHTVVISDPNGATLTFVDTIDATSETRNRRVRVVAALGIDAWRESVNTNLVRDTLAPGVGVEDDSTGTAVGRVECELGRVLTLPVHGSVTDALNPVLLVTLNGSQDAPWSTLQEKGCAVVEHLGTSISSIGDGLKSGQTPPMMKYSQPRAR